MSQKPIYQGTYQQYQKLPYEVRKYYAPPVATPPGYEYESSKTVYPKQVYGVTYGTKEKPQPTPPYEQVTFKPKVYEVPTQWFGPKTEYYDPKTGIFKEELTTRQGEKILVTVNPRLEGPKTASPLEQQAISGATLATTTAVGVGVPMAGLTALGTVGAGATVKGAVVGKPLTPEEAIGLASVGTLLYFGASKAAPYARQAYRSVYNRLLPEHAMYNRVVASQQQQIPSSQQTLTERILGRVSPERALYNRVVRNVTPKPSGDIISGGGGGASQWVQQQVLLRQAPVQKAPMKPFVGTAQASPQQLALLVPSVTRTVAKTTQKQLAKQVSKQQTQLLVTVPQQIQNPFLKYKGKPYYRVEREQEEMLLPIVYPSQSPLSSPSFLSSLSRLGLQRQAALQRQIQNSLLGQGQTQGLNQLQRQAETQVQEQVQRQRQVQEQVQRQQQAQDYRRWFSLSAGNVSGFRRGRVPPLLRGYRYREKKHAVLTAKELLEAYGL